MTTNQWRRVAGAAPIRAVVFDLDGVLTNSFEVMRAAFAIAYREVVGPGDPPFAEYLTCQGMYFPEITRRLGLPAEMERPFVEASARLVDRVQVYPGVRELLEQLRQDGIATAVATGKSGERARHVLQVHGLLPQLDAVVGSDEIPRPKPSPDIVHEALRRLKASAAEGALLVGDAVTDIRSGRAAGVITAAATWGETDAELLRAEHPDLVIGSPDELRATLARGAEVTS